MFRVEYEIQFDPEDNGRPYIEFVGNTVDEMNFVEHKFLAFELVRTIITQNLAILDKKEDKSQYLINEIEKLRLGLIEVSKISNTYARVIKEQFELLATANRLTQKYDVEVKTIEDRDRLNYNGFIYKNTILKRQIGLKVRVQETDKVYELVDGIDNIHWTEL